MTTNEGKAITFDKKTVLKVVYKDLNEVEVKKIIQEEEKKQEAKNLKEEKKETTTTTDTKKEEKRRWWSPVWRSAIVPGWGVYHTSKKFVVPGLIFLATAGAFSYATSTNNEFNSAQSDYTGRSTFISLASLSSPTAGGAPDGTRILLGALINESFYQPVNSAAETGNNAQRILGAVYGLQLLYTAYLGRKWEKEAPKTAVILNGKAIPEGWNFYASQQPTIYGETNKNYEISYAFHY
ncbi:MAG: hypothetical protein SFU98_06925 [Leptospiraceae bacterium]|nr:hypothetical protein [Leptospiraceae bacterium]